MKHSVALIREAECIGCAKCLPACPVDAIIGANKFLHTVITDECIGCKLCLAPCPVDCIDMVEIPGNLSAETHTDRLQKSQHIRSRVQAHQARLRASDAAAEALETIAQQEIEDYLHSAIQRSKSKKS